MLEFRDITLNDRDKANEALQLSDFMSCEHSFANNLAWCRLADSKICFFKDFYVICAFGNEDGIPTFTFPAGNGDLLGIFGEMKRFSNNMGYPFRVCCVNKKNLELLREIFPDSFTVAYDRNGSDYIYLRNDLAQLSGKKYHQKRNHLARFKQIESEFSIMTENDFDDCISFITNDYNKKDLSDITRSAIAEQYAVNTYFNNFRELGLVGGLIRIDGKIAAVTIGERLNSNTFCVHIEKADRQFDGIYVGICNSFVNACTDGFEYINREDDLGLEGLRKSKLSYHPAFLLDKYIIDFK